MLPELNGYAISAADLLADFFVEHDPAELEQDPAEWPAWTGTRVGIGPAYTPDEVIPDPPAPDPDPDQGDEYEPSPEDRRDFAAWAWEQDRRNQDLEDMARECDYLEQLEAEQLYTDQDLMAAGLPVG